MTSTPPRGAYAPGRARQAQILDAATQVFAARGFRGGSLRDIAEKAHITPGAVLHHFASKEALLFAVLDQRDSARGPDMEVRLTTGDFIGSLRQIVSDNMRDRVGTRLFTTISAEATDPAHPAHNYFIQRYQMLTELVAAQLLPLLGRKATSNQAQTAAQNVLGMMDGLQVRWLFNENFDMVGAFDHYLLDVGLLDAV